MFCLELPEPYLVTGTKPTGLLKMFVERAASDEGKHSALTWKLQVCEGGSDLTCKTNSTLPSFVKSREEVSMRRANFRPSSQSNEQLVFNRLLNLVNFNQMTLFTSKKTFQTGSCPHYSDWCKVSALHLSCRLLLLSTGLLSSHFFL